MYSQIIYKSYKIFLHVCVYVYSVCVCVDSKFIKLQNVCFFRFLTILTMQA